MAFIPDAAIANCHTLTPGAWRLFCVLCQRRDHRAGVSRLNVERGCELLNLKRAQFFAAQRELLAGGWIGKNEQGAFILTGDFAPVEKRQQVASDSLKNQTETPENQSSSLKIQTGQSENSDPKVQKIRPDSLKNQTPKSENSDSHIKALSSPSIQPLHPAHLSSPHPHTATATTAPDTGQNAGVGVAEKSSPNGKPRSQFTLADSLRYVERCRAKGEHIHSPNALARNLHRSGEADELIRATLYPAQTAAAERATYGEPRAFTDQPCSVCFGSRFQTEAGKGARPCGNCRDERGRATGKQPESE